MNGKLSKTETFNAALRGGILVVLIAVVCFAYLWLLMHDKPSGALEGSVLSLASGAFVWWFKSRDDKAAADATALPLPGPASPPAP